MIRVSCYQNLVGFLRVLSMSSLLYNFVIHGVSLSPYTDASTVATEKLSVNICIRFGNTNFSRAGRDSSFPSGHFRQEVMLSSEIRIYFHPVRQYVFSFYRPYPKLPAPDRWRGGFYLDCRIFLNSVFVTVYTFMEWPSRILLCIIIIIVRVAECLDDGDSGMILNRERNILL